jgi:hypothetical protein
MSSLAPPHVMLSSFNEWVAQPQPNPFNPQFSYSVGLPWDAQRTDLWVDSFGDSMSRDIEPSVADGSSIFDIMESCLRVARIAAGAEIAALQGHARSENRSAAVAWLQHHFGRAAAAPHAAASCSVTGELCCAFNVTTDEYAVVWSLALDSGADAMVSALPNEVEVSSSQSK